MTTATQGLQAARELQTKERTRILQLERKRREGALVDRAGAEKAIFERARLERDAWRAWVTRTAPLLAGDLCVDERAVFAALDAYVRDHLEQLADVGLVDLDRVG